MKIVLITMEKDLISVDNALVTSSISMNFIGNQLKKKKIEIIIITLNSIKSRILLKMLEYGTHKYIKCLEDQFYPRKFKKFNYESWNKIELQVQQWYRIFIKINIDSLIELLFSSALFILEELVELSLYGIAIIFLRRIDIQSLANFENIFEEKNFFINSFPFFFQK